MHDQEPIFHARQRRLMQWQLARFGAGGKQVRDFSGYAEES